MRAASAAGLHDVVSALAYSLAADHAHAGSPHLGAPYNDLAQFVLRQQARMSDPLQPALAALTHAFDYEGLLRAGRRFRHQSPESRRRQLEAWRGSSLGFKRDFVRFYESLVVLALHSRALPPASATPPAPAMAPSGGVITDPSGAFLCEVAVIGSGPGGSITACLLAEAGRDVLLIEEGPLAPLESAAAFSIHEVEQKYRHGGISVALGRTKIAYVEGRCVGGGSEINSGLYHRTSSDVLENWRRGFGVEALAESDLRPHFEACERDLSVSTMPPGTLPAASLKLHDGATRLGWKSVEVPRWFRYDPPSAGAQGSRQSMTRTYLPRFLAAGGRLLPDTRITSLRRSGKTWELRATRARGDVRIAAETVFICGGAIQTPALLRRSGITHRVGDGLQVHPTAKLVARFPDVVNAAAMGVPVHQVKEFAPRLSFGCSISAPPHLAVGLLDHRDAARSVATDWPHLATYYAMITSEGGGSVRNVPGRRDPLVRYRLTPNDRRELADGLRRLARAMFEAGATQVYPALPGTQPWLNAADAERSPREFPAGASGLMTIHLFSSCPMGEQRDRCVADSFGRVHGVRGLHLADASLLCTAPGVNPQGTIMALARRNALHFLGQL